MRYKPEERGRFKSKLQTMISITLIALVIFMAFLIFANMKKKLDNKVFSAHTMSKVSEEAMGEEDTYQNMSIDEVYIVKGNDKSSNRFERADKLCYTDTLKYTEEDLKKLDDYGLRITRNEIYARHGRMFLEQDLQTYFDRQPWYVPTVSPEKFDDECLNDIENYNINLIVKYEMRY